MKYKYQLILIGENEAFFKALEIELKKGFDELKIISDILKVMREQDIDNEYSGGQPAFVIYAGHKNNITGRQLEILEKQKLDGNIILPIYEKNFNEEMPKILEN